ncbi:hypothetical protein CGJ06_24475 [Vibrio parahaemolyticus]|nr:hypothetical protein CGJ06_24475 [Vibrio parahaemolyticus]
MWSFLSSFGNSFRFICKSTLFANASFERLPQLSFGLREVSQFVAKSLWKFCVRTEFSESDLLKFSGFQIA